MYNLLDVKIYHEGLGEFISFDKEGISHAIYAKTYYLKAMMIYQVVEIIQLSTMYAIEKDRLNRPDIRKIYRMVSEWSYDGTDYVVYIIIREKKNGNFFYDHGIIKEKPW